MKILFTKYHANGNDFILVLDEDFPKKFRQQNIISRLCHRHFGIGADGMFIIASSKDSEFFLDYYSFISLLYIANVNHDKYFSR